MLLLDKYNRKINYLRISITDRCNLRCTYCMPEKGIKLLNHSNILRYEEIIDIVKVAVELGINKIRITGGEPLIRKGVVEFIKMLKQINGIEDICLTTNAVLLEQFAKTLANAGLNRVNVSLDTLNYEKFKEISRGGDLTKVIRGIFAAKEAGFHPIKINCVIKHSVDENDAQDVANFASLHGFQARFIKTMNLASGVFSHVIDGEGGDCAKCNRLRLTSDGYILPCLFSNLKFNVKELGTKEAILQAVNSKPSTGKNNNLGQFYNIGG